MSCEKTRRLVPASVCYLFLDKGFDGGKGFIADGVLQFAGIFGRHAFFRIPALAFRSACGYNNMDKKIIQRQCAIEKEVWQ